MNRFHRFHLVEKPVKGVSAKDVTSGLWPETLQLSQTLHLLRKGRGILSTLQVCRDFLKWLRDFSRGHIVSSKRDQNSGATQKPISF